MLPIKVCAALEVLPDRLVQGSAMHCVSYGGTGMSRLQLERLCTVRVIPPSANFSRVLLVELQIDACGEASIQIQQ